MDLTLYIFEFFQINPNVSYTIAVEIISPNRELKPFWKGKWSWSTNLHLHLFWNDYSNERPRLLPY